MRGLQSVLRSVAIAIFITAAGCAGATAGAHVDGPRARELVSGGATLVDVRTPEEYAAGHVDGALNVPVDEVAARIAEIPRERPVVVYCHSGRRAARAAETLQQNGYEVYDLGPMSAW